MTIRKLTALTTIVLLFGVGCFKKDKILGDESVVPSIPNVVFSGPLSNNVPTDLKQYVGLFNGNDQTSMGLNYLDLAIFLTPSVDGNNYTWQVAWGQIDAVIKAVANANNSVDWTVTVDGTENDVTYTNWVAMRGNSNLDGDSGTWDIFLTNSTIKNAEFTWTVNSNDVKNGTLQFLSDNYTYDLVNNPDKSGTLVMKQNNATLYRAEWSATGSGSWTTWDSQGNQTDSGSWN